MSAPVPRRRLTEDASCSPSRAVDVRYGYRPVSSFRSYALTASLSLPPLTSSSTCQRQQSPVLARRLHQGVNLTAESKIALRGAETRRKMPAQVPSLWASRAVRPAARRGHRARASLPFHPFRVGPARAHDHSYADVGINRPEQNDQCGRRRRRDASSVPHAGAAAPFC